MHESHPDLIHTDYDCSLCQDTLSHQFMVGNKNGGAAAGCACLVTCPIPRLQASNRTPPLQPQGNVCNPTGRIFNTSQFKSTAPERPLHTWVGGSFYLVYSVQLSSASYDEKQYSSQQPQVGCSSRVVTLLHSESPWIGSTPKGNLPKSSRSHLRVHEGGGALFVLETGHQEVTTTLGTTEIRQAALHRATAERLRSS